MEGVCGDATPATWFSISSVIGLCDRSRRKTALGGILAIGWTVQVFTLRSTFVVLITALLGSCSISEHVVQDGPFQKRKYFKRGWFFDPPKRSGMEELAIEQIEKEEVEMDRDPYLEVLAVDRLTTDELTEVRLPALDLSSSSHSEKNKIGTPIRTTPDIVKMRSDRPIPTIPEPGYGTMYPMMSTGFAFLLPVALLLALVALIRRIGNLSGDGSKAEFVALLMGMAGLAALAVV